MDYATFIADPEFAAYFTTTDPARLALIERFLAKANCDVDLVRYPTTCDYRDRDIRLQTAHDLVMFDRLSFGEIPGTPSGIAASPGQVSSVSASKGSNSVSFQLPDPARFKEFGTLDSTPWGLRLLELRRNFRYRPTGFLC